MQTMATSIPAVMIVFLLACSTPLDTDIALDQVTGDTSAVTDLAAPDKLSSDEESLPDEQDIEIPFELPFDTDTGELDTTTSDVIEPGMPGYPCLEDADCLSDFCIPTPNGFQCTQTCLEECPFNWTCALHQASSPDEVWICMPADIILCRPCNLNSECLAAGADVGARCLRYGDEGSFCGVPCDDDCPAGYSCQGATDVTGGVGQGCILDEGLCECTQMFADNGAQTSCTLSNDFGQCEGSRLCTADGLTECDADIPAAEICNSIDDNCDGTEDEGLGGDLCKVENQFGTCDGTTTCIAGVEGCDGPEPAPEICDGLDNDCDGTADEGFEDTDNDGIKDCLESDKDGDGIVDGQDNCPIDKNPNQLDSDFDDKGDICDADDDNDLHPDAADCAPLDNKINPDAEEKCDGIDNNCSGAIDEDFADTDGDGTADCIDEDDDNDGVLDAADCAPLDATVYSGAEELCDGKDNNCDFVIDEGHPDLDNDGQADCIDDDLDGDGVLDVEDNCPLLSNPAQEDMDGDNVGDICDVDMDGDAIPDATDNCPGLKNPLQTDTDDDDIGNACDDDLDGDGVSNDVDLCPLVADDQADTDNDGIGDACSGDKDGDGSPDSQDCKPLNPAIHPDAFEECDGVDNDCNYLVDEGFIDSDSDGLKDCIDQDDDNDGFGDDGDCQPLNAAVNPQATEICNGIDDDCDDKTDEDLGTITCGKGQCNHTIELCQNGLTQFCDPYEGIAVEVCDGNDNDCNGLTDEGLGQTTCGLGLCQQTITNCQDGQVQQCDPSAGAVDEFCDGLDNDCDGKVDEEQPSLACGKGLCFHTISSCLGGVIQECDPFAGAMPEVCDGVDNDCDGEKDEELGQVTCGLGPCEHTIDYCQEGKIQVCNPFEGVQAEICDGADNDCDGLADEELGFLQCGLGMCAHTVTNCINGQPQECDPFEGALDEICDGLDNDCDGGADEDLGLSTCGQGECQHTIFACTNGQLTECDPFEGAVDEICDGLDNNCDGDIDEGFVDTDIDGDADCIDTDDDDDGDLDDDDCQPLDADIGPSVTEICFDGVDNDCDGLSADDPECLFESCEALLAAYPEATDGSYTLDVDGEDGTLPFDTVCDMANGGWTLILKATGTKTLWYGSGYWTDDTLLADDDLTTDAGDAKYASFLHLPVTVMKGCLDDHCYSKTFDGAQTAKQIFSGGASVVSGLPGFGTSEKWSAQPNCQHFGINTPYNYQSSRFGYTANQEGDCNSNDTAVGLGLGPKGSSAESSKKGAGFLCISSNCSKGNVDSGATGLLWVR